MCGFSSLLLSGRENVMWYTVNYDLFLFLCPFFLLSKSSRVFFFSLLPDSFSFFLSISLPIPWGQRQPGITEGDDLARTWRREGSRRPGQLLRRPDLTWPAPAPGGSPWHGARSLGFHINWRKSFCPRENTSSVTKYNLAFTVSTRGSHLDREKMRTRPKRFQFLTHSKYQRLRY